MDRSADRGYPAAMFVCVFWNEISHVAIRPQRSYPLLVLVITSAFQLILSLTFITFANVYQAAVLSGIQ